MTKITYKQIDLAGWEKVGEGGNGSVYTCHEQPSPCLRKMPYRLYLSVAPFNHSGVVRWSMTVT